MPPVTPRRTLLAGSLVLTVCSTGAQGETPVDNPTLLQEITVTGARNDEEALCAARSVGNSMLVKTSWNGDYPNWGRIMDALGYSSAKIVEEKVEIRYANLVAVKNGVAVAG